MRIAPGRHLREAPAVTDLAVVYRDPASLRGFERNARTHSIDQVALLRRSIDTYGFTNPVLLRDDGVSIGAGHGRVAASLLEPALERVPTIIVPGLTEEQWRAYILADNAMALGAGWDQDLLRAELSDLKGLGLDLSLMGFGEVELGALFGSEPDERDPDETPPVPMRPSRASGIFGIAAPTASAASIAWTSNRSSD